MVLISLQKLTTKINQYNTVRFSCQIKYLPVASTEEPCALGRQAKRDMVESKSTIKINWYTTVLTSFQTQFLPLFYLQEGAVGSLSKQATEVYSISLEPYSRHNILTKLTSA